MSLANKSSLVVLQPDGIQIPVLAFHEHTSALEAACRAARKADLHHCLATTETWGQGAGENGILRHRKGSAAAGKRLMNLRSGITGSLPAFHGPGQRSRRIAPAQPKKPEAPPSTLIGSQAQRPNPLQISHSGKNWP